MRFLIFLTIALSVFALLTYYVKKRFVNKLHLSSQFKKYLTWFLVINYFGIILYMYSRYNPVFPNWAFFILSLPIGVLFLFFVVTLLYDLTRVVLEKSPMDDKRRDFFKKGLDFGAFAITAPVIVHSVKNALHVEIEDVEIKIKNLGREYTIAQLSDVHIGGLINAKAIANIVKQVNSLNPDVVVITGDLVDIKLEYAKEALEELNKLKSTYGTFFIAGNHEYIHGIEKIVAYMKTLDVTVLENSSVYIGDLIDGFNLAGVYDVMGYRMKHHEPDISKALKGTKKYRPTILLAHQPRYINEVFGIDVMLSGHTHGGQIFPFNYLVRLQQPYVAGLYQHDSNTQIYVNKGTGFWGPPMRLGTSCEVTNITIRNA